MAGAFDMSEQAMLELLESLIGNGRINGRIDLIDKVGGYQSCIGYLRALIDVN